MAKIRWLNYQEYLQTPHWKAKKQEAYNYYGASCVLCGSRKSINVHHREYNNKWNEPMSDLTVLCYSCHDGHHKIARQIKFAEQEVLDVEKFCKEILEDDEDETQIKQKKYENWTLESEEYKQYLLYLEKLREVNKRIIMATTMHRNGKYIRKGCVCGNCSKSKVGGG